VDTYDGPLGSRTPSPVSSAKASIQWRLKKQRRREAVDLAFDNYARHFTHSCKGEGWRRLVERVVRLHLEPVLRKKPLPSITRADIVSVLDQMPEEQVANRRNVFAVMRRLFRWAISRGDLDRSPIEGMETPPPVRRGIAGFLTRSCA